MTLKHLPATLMSFNADHHRTTWLVKAPPTTTIEDFLRPNFWAHHIQRLKRLDKVEVIADDGSFECELRCMERAVGYAKMRLLSKWEASAEEKAEGAKALAEKVVVEKKFPRVDFTKVTQFRILGHDGQEVERDIATKDEADKKLADYIQRSKAA